MRIDPKSKIAGMPALRIRDLLRRAEDFSWKVDFVQDTLRVSRSQANRIVSELAERGYIRPDDLNKYKGYWRLSTTGTRLALATAAKPLRRSTAEKRLRELMDRAKEVNENSTYLYKVAKMGIFGSYLSNKELLNDVDVAIVLEPKELNTEKLTTLIGEKVAKVKQRGRQFSNFTDELFWPQIEILKYLKSRSRALSLHRLSNMEYEALESKLEIQVTGETSNSRFQS